MGYAGAARQPDGHLYRRGILGGKGGGNAGLLGRQVSGPLLLLLRCFCSCPLLCL